MSISPLNNPTTGLTGLLGSLVNGGGQFLQGIDQTKSKFDLQQSIHDVLGDSDAIDGQQQANHQAEEFDKNLLGLAEQGKEERQLQQLANGLRQADDTNTNNVITGDIKTAQGITF